MQQNAICFSYAAFRLDACTFTLVIEASRAPFCQLMMQVNHQAEMLLSSCLQRSGSSRPPEAICVKVSDKALGVRYDARCGGAGSITTRDQACRLRQ